MVALGVSEVVDCRIGVGAFLHELMGDPFQGAAMGVVFGSKDPMVSVAQVGLLLVEDM